MDINKGDDVNPEYRARWVAQELGHGQKDWELFAATPPLEQRCALGQKHQPAAQPAAHARASRRRSQESKENNRTNGMSSQLEAAVDRLQA